MEDIEKKPYFTNKPGLDKLITKCPECNKAIHLSDLNLECTNKPGLIDCLIFHPQENGSKPHALIIYLDRDLKMRGNKVIFNIS